MNAINNNDGNYNIQKEGDEIDDVDHSYIGDKYRDSIES